MQCGLASLDIWIIFLQHFRGQNFTAFHQYNGKIKPWGFYSWGFNTCLSESEDLGCIQKLRQLTCCLAALSGNDFAGSVCAWSLMIYNKIEQVSEYLITTNFLLEMTSKVKKVDQKHTLQTDHQPQLLDAIFIF